MGAAWRRRNYRAIRPRRPPLCYLRALLQRSVRSSVLALSCCPHRLQPWCGRRRRQQRLSAAAIAPRSVAARRVHADTSGVRTPVTTAAV